MSKNELRVKAGGLTPEGYQMLAKAVGWEHRSEAQARDLIINARHAVTAWQNETLIGMARATGNGAQYAHLVDIAVRPTHHGNGVGSAILHHLLKLIDRETSPEATITLHSIAGAEGFYARFGFVASETPGLMIRNRNH
jgi:predicted GNAT family N-acyltransferase